MINKKYLRTMGIGLFLLSFSWFGCDTEDPAVIFDPDDSGQPAPVINSVEPPIGIAIIGRITLNGNNFSSDVNDNLVYFEDKLATVESASPTQLVVVAPDTVKDSLRIRLFVNGAFQSTDFFPYELDAVNKEYGDFTSSDNINSLEVDNNENVYVHLRARNVTMVTPNGDKSEYATTSFNRSGEMRFGPGGYLYIQRANTTTPDEELHRVPPGGGASELYLTFPTRVFSFDFDQNGILFGGARDSGFYAVNSNAEITRTGKLTDFDIRSVRVYDGYVYGAAEYRGSDAGIPAQAVWRCQILSNDGQLGDPEVAFDWATTGDSSGSDLQTVAFDENGVMYIGTTNLGDTNPITVVHPDGSHEPLYPGLLQFQSRQLVWGNSVILYENRGGFFPANRRLVRIIMTAPSAPYYGRQL